MSKHIKIRPGLYINLDAIAFTEPIFKKDVKLEDYRNLFSLEELKSVGYDEPLVFRLHLMAPTGGIGVGRVRIDVRPDEFKVIEENFGN